MSPLQCRPVERSALDWNKLRAVADGPVPVVRVDVQDVDSGEVLVVAYANEEAVVETLLRRCAVFWSTSRQQIHDKGATSGEVPELEDVLVNCEGNSLLYRVRVRGCGACHVQTDDGPPFSCFLRTFESLDPFGDNCSVGRPFRSAPASWSS